MSDIMFWVNHNHTKPRMARLGLNITSKNDFSFSPIAIEIKSSKMFNAIKYAMGIGWTPRTPHKLSVSISYDFGNDLCIIKSIEIDHDSLDDFLNEVHEY
jgi:hypothetical protein